MGKLIYGYFDGSCLDPIKDGPLGYGYHANEFGKSTGSLFKKSESKGIGTNNQAEIIALYKLMNELSKRCKGDSIYVRGDSQIIVNMINGDVGVKNPFLKEYVKKIRDLEGNFEEVVYEHIPREQNSLADKLSKRSLPEKPKDYYNYRF